MTLHLVARHVALDPRHVQPDLLGDRERARLVGLAAAAQQLLVEVHVLLAGLVLHADGDRDAGRLDRARPEHRKLLEHDLELGIALHQREHVVHGALAVAAVVIEELDEGDVALRVADHDLTRRIEDRLGVVLDRGLVFRGFVGGLLLLQLGHRLLQHFRMLDEIFADDLFDLAALRA